MTQDFKLIKSGIDVSKLLEQVRANDHLFKMVTARQDYPGSNHKDTEAIFLRWCKTLTVEAAFTEIEAIDYPPLQMLPAAMPLILESIFEAGGSKLGRVMIVNLKPGGQITPHYDGGEYADYYERFHLSLESEDGNLFFVGTPGEQGEFVHMKPGELWWFNHKKVHWVNNLSDKPRLHLIMDIVAPLYRREREKIDCQSVPV